MTALLSMAILGEMPDRKRWIGIAAFLGVVLVMWGADGVVLSGGLLFIAASAFAGSLAAVLMKSPGVRPLRVPGLGGDRVRPAFGDAHGRAGERPVLEGARRRVAIRRRGPVHRSSYRSSPRSMHFHSEVSGEPDRAFDGHEPARPESGDAGDRRDGRSLRRPHGGRGRRSRSWGSCS